MCAAPDIEERVDSLEAIFGRFMINTDAMMNRMERDTRLLKQEMREFKDEMRVFKDEMSDFKDEMSDFKDEMGACKDEMGAFKNEMGVFKDKMEQDHKAMNKQWGDLANKMGTLVEDIISPAIRPVVTKYFDCEITYFSVNVRKKDRRLNLQGEFDVIAVSDDYVFLVEAKSTPKKQYLYEFIENIETFRKLFPEYADKRLIPIFGSLRFDENMIQLATEEKVYLLAYREWEYMDFLNFDKLGQK